MISDPEAAYSLPNGDETRIAYIAGAGGTGKTFVYTALNHYARWKDLLGHNTAFSGIAANLLPRGRTVHNLFGLPIRLQHDTNSNIDLGTKAARELASSAYILCDEAPMLPRYALECGSRKLKEIENFDKKDPESDDPFGNHAVILGGDFCQTLPVVRGGSREQKLNATIKRSYLWPLMKQFRLTKNLRARDAQEFAKFVRNVGRGIPNSDEPEGYCRLPKKNCTKRSLAEKISAHCCVIAHSRRSTRRLSSPHSTPKWKRSMRRYSTC